MGTITRPRRKLDPFCPAVAELVQTTLELPPPDETMVLRREPRPATIQVYRQLLRRVTA